MSVASAAVVHVVIAILEGEERLAEGHNTELNAEVGLLMVLLNESPPRGQVESVGGADHTEEDARIPALLCELGDVGLQE